MSRAKKSPTGRRTTVLEALPFLRGASRETRRDIIASTLRPGAPSGQSLAQIRVADVTAADRHRRLATVVADCCLVELCMDMPIKKLVPSVNRLNSVAVRKADVGNRLFNLLLDHDLLTWDKLRVLRPRDVLELHGAGVGAASDLLAYAIWRGLEATTDEPHGASASAGSAQRAALSKVMRNANGSLLLALLDEFATSLPVGTLAAPVLTGRPRAAALEMTSAVTLQDVRRFLADQTDEAGRLSQAFNTTRRRGLLAESLTRFDSRLLAWAAGDLWDQNMQWIIPQPLRSRTFRLDDGAVRSKLGALSKFARRLSTADDIGIWLPIISIEGVIQLKKLRAPDVPYLITALARGAASLQLEPKTRPWDAAFSPKLAALPLTWLYQHSPAPRMLTLIERLERGGYTNVGHLGVLHPDALGIMRSSAVSEWTALRSALAVASRG